MVRKMKFRTIPKILKNWKDNKIPNELEYKKTKQRLYSELLFSTDYNSSLQYFDRLTWHDRIELIERIPTNINEDFLDRFIMRIAEQDNDHRVRNSAFEKILKISTYYKESLQSSIFKRIEKVYSNLAIHHRLIFIHKHANKRLPENYMMSFFHKIATHEIDVNAKKKACKILENFVTNNML